MLKPGIRQVPLLFLPLQLDRLGCLIRHNWARPREASELPSYTIVAVHGCGDAVVHILSLMHR